MPHGNFCLIWDPVPSMKNFAVLLSQARYSTDVYHVHASAFLLFDLSNAKSVFVYLQSSWCNKHTTKIERSWEPSPYAPVPHDNQPKLLVGSTAACMAAWSGGCYLEHVPPLPTQLGRPAPKTGYLHCQFLTGQASFQFKIGLTASVRLTSRCRYGRRRGGSHGWVVVVEWHGWTIRTGGWWVLSVWWVAPRNSH